MRSKREWHKLIYLLNRLVQLDHTVDRSNGQLRRDLFLTLVSDDRTAIRFGGGLNGGFLTLINDDSTAIGFGRNLNDGSLTLVNDDGTTIRLGGGLNEGGLAFGNRLEISLSG
jgi:hypothetical protein